MSEQLSCAASLALGTVQWGLAYGIANRHGKPAEAEVARLLERAKSAGVTTLDTARSYADSEAIIGRLVGGTLGWEVFTKLDPAALTTEEAMESLQVSRGALRRPILDGVLLHRASQRTAAGGAVWNVLRRERDEGRIRILGISAGSPEEAWAALDDSDVSCIQVPSSLFDQRLSRSGFFEDCHRRNRIVFVRSIFLQGTAHLSPEELPQHLTGLGVSLAAARAWAASRGAAPALAFLAFAAGLPGVRILLGCETAAQLDENLIQWEAARQKSREIGPLVDSVPQFGPEVLNPALWPKVAS